MANSTERREASAFLHELRGALQDVTKFLADREYADEATRDVGRRATDTVSVLGEELDRFQEAVDESQDIAGPAASVSRSVGGPQALAAQRKMATSQSTDVAKNDSLKTALAIGETYYKKLAEYIPDQLDVIPVKAIAKDIAEILALTQKLMDTTGSEIRRIEQKVASLQESIHGVGFPQGQISGPVTDGKPTIRSELEDLENKLEAFFHVVTGNPVQKEPDGSVPIPDIRDVRYPQLKGSLLWMAWDIEHKLEWVFARLTGKRFERNMDGAVIAPMSLPGVSIDATLEELKAKIDTLAKLLGKTLYDVDWNVEPNTDGSLRTVPRGSRHENAVPPRSIKDEIHDLEDGMQLLLQLVRQILLIVNQILILIIPGPPPPPPPVVGVDPDDSVLRSVLPVDLKRIYVYDEGIFQATDASDTKVVTVRTGAFDLAGWVDLTELADGDAVEVACYVRLPGPRRRLYRDRTFRDRTDAGLLALQDVVGPAQIAGSGVDVEIKQVASASGFAPPLEIAYQFVVESQ